MHGTGRGVSVTLLRWHPAHLPAPGSETGTPMRFTAFVPLPAAQGALPLVWYLSGLICTEENFTVKAGAQRIAAELGLLLVARDTSPRGDGGPRDPTGS